MTSLNTSSSFIKDSVSGVSRTQSQLLRLSVRRPMVVAMVNSNGRPERNVGVSVDSAIKEVNAPVAVEVADSDGKKPTTVVGGGVEDVYGEDTATEDHFITPWSVSVASGYSLLRDPHHNKGLAFTEKERDAHYLRGLLLPVVVNHDLQVKKMMHNLRQYEVPLQRYQAMMDLQGMGIPVGKLSLYTALGGIRPSALNRDTWANEAVAQTITSNFIFWQLCDDTEEGSKAITYYKLDSVPATLVIDSITGQQMRLWRGMIQPDSLLEDVIEYMDSSPIKAS